LYHNNGDGTFTKITTGEIVNDGGTSANCSWCDFNNDNYLDLFVVNGGHNFLYRNNGDQTFTKIQQGEIVTDDLASISGSWGDYNNDGYLDLFVSNLGHQNCLYRNNGNSTFTKITSDPIFNDIGLCESSSWGDYDNDGDLDLFVTREDKKNNLLYTNNGDGTFTKIINEIAVNDSGYSFGGSWCDYDNDGDLDLFVANTVGNNFLYVNNGNSNHWINIKCTGTFSNTSAIGAKIGVKALINGNDTWQTQEISGQTGGYSQNSLNLEFGLGDATVVDSIIVYWDNGTTNILANILPDQFLTIMQLEERTTFTQITTGIIVNDGGESKGCSWGDYNNDGNQDLFVANNGDNFLYMYDGIGSDPFTEIKSGDIVKNSGDSYAGTWGDYNNDGYLDIFVSNNGVNFLYTNNGDSTFTRVNNSNDPIVSDDTFSKGASWCDFDNDGWLDLFVANKDESNLLYHNNKDGTFTRITSGEIVNESGISHSGVWGDYNNDGYQDLYVLNAGNNFLYRNNGDKTFTKILTGAIVNDAYISHSGCWGDYDNDGDLDMYVANSENQNNCLYQNNGDGSFTKVTSGLIVEDANESRSCCWGDYNNDGDLDLYVTNDNQKDRLYVNEGNGKFSKYTDTDMPNVENEYPAYGCGWCDVNNDGGLDLYITNSQGHNYAYLGDENIYHWINLKCVGTLSNTSAIGTKINICTLMNNKYTWQMQEILGQSGGFGQNSLNVEFGLNDATIIDSLLIEWPSGVVQLLTNLSVDQYLTIIESDSGQARLKISKNLSCLPGNSFTIPITCSNVTDLSIYSVGFSILYDNSVIEAVNATIGTMADSSGWDQLEYNVVPGQINIAMVGSSPLAGSGTLVNVICNVVGKNDDSTTLHFKNTILNEGDPIVFTRDGLLQIRGFEIKGRLDYYSDTTFPVKDALVQMIGVKNDSSVANESGYYEFSALSSGRYTITPQKNGDQKNAISPYDASFVLRHEVETYSLTPYQQIAADVTGNGDPTSYDASYILRYCVGSVTTFPVGSDWTFVPHDYPIDTSTWATAPNSRSYTPLDSSQLDQDYIGILYGDVSGNWARPVNGSSNVIAEITMDNIHRNSNKKWLVPLTIKCSEGVFSGIFKFLFNDSDLKFESGKIINFASDEVIFAVHSKENEISFAFASKQPLKDQPVQINFVFEELNPITPAITDFRFDDVKIDDKSTIVTLVENGSGHRLPTDWHLDQNHPNPFNPETSITYQVPKKSIVKIEVFNLLGQRIKRLVNEEKSPGYYQVTWNGRYDQEKSVVSGIYLYRMRAGDFREIKRMIFLR